MLSELDTLCWRWELTPTELMAGFRFIQSGAPKPGQLAESGAARLANEVRPFTAPKLPLEGTSLLFQIAISSKSITTDMQLLRLAHPELPESGDRRSGVLVFNADGRVVGSLTIKGMLTQEGYKMVVQRDYRQQGLAIRMLNEWCWATKRQKVLPKQDITLNSTRALLSSHRFVVDRAVKRGIKVPARVLEAITGGEQATAIIAEATRIEQLVRVQPERRHLFRRRSA